MKTLFFWKEKLGININRLHAHECTVSLFCSTSTKSKSFIYCTWSRGVQPAAHGPHAAQDGCECGPTQNHKFTENIIRFFFLWIRVAMYLMCGPRQLFFRCGPEMPKCWTPLKLRIFLAMSPGGITPCTSLALLPLSSVPLSPSFFPTPLSFHFFFKPDNSYFSFNKEWLLC